MMKPEDVIKAEERGTWKSTPVIVTATGGEFPFEGFDASHICIEDIAKSLSQLCRFTGHTSLFYSVAQHSLLVAEKMPGPPKEKLVGLLHDAAEAYTNDLASPLKAYLESQCDYVYRDLQARITAAVYDRFGVAEIPDDVRLYDCAAGVFEAEGLMGLGERELHDFRFPTHLRGLWSPWNPREWAGTSGDQEPGEVETSFLLRFEELMTLCGREEFL